MDSRRWLHALGALAAALLAALIVDLAGDRAGAPGGRILPDWDPAGVRSVEIAHRGRPPLRVARDGEGWRLAAPIAAPADPSAVADLLGTLEILAPRRRADGAVADPVLSVTVERSGRPAVTLDLAADAGKTDRVWLSRRGDDARALIDGYQMRALDLTADDLRERRPFRGRLAGATRIEVGGAILAGPPWRIGGVRADPDRVAALVAALERLRATSFRATPPAGAPTLTISVAGVVGSSELAVRGDCPDGGAAATSPVGAVCLPRAAVEEIGRIAGGSLVDRRLLAAAPDQVSRVRVSAGDRSIEVASADKPDVVRDWAARFTAAAADGAPIPAADLPTAGAVEVDSDQGGREEIAILRAPGGRLAARRAGEPVAFVLADPAAADPAPASFRSLDLLTADATEVVSLRRGREAVERGELLEEWRALAPPGAQADPEAATLIAETIATLRAVRVAPGRSRAPQDSLVVELAPPPGQGERVRRRISLSAAAGGACHVRIDDDPVAFELAPATCAALRRPLVSRSR